MDDVMQKMEFPMTDPARNSRAAGPGLTAVVVAALLILAGGVIYRLVDRQLDRPSDAVPLPPGTLARIPMKLGAWQGWDIPLAEAVIRATDTDDHINRGYRLPGQTNALGLFVAYGVRSRDLMPHRPDVCYPGAGWTLRGRERVDLKSVRGQVIPCTLYRFTGG